MLFKQPTPGEVKRTFANNELRQYRTPRLPDPKTARKNTRAHRSTNNWPGSRLNYNFINKCKEIICRIPHPTAVYRHKKAEYHLSVLPWSRGAYVDIRLMFQRDDEPGGYASTGRGILLHLDVISALLPELIGLVRRLENEDAREPEQKAKVKVIVT